MIRFLVDEDFNNDILRGLRRRLPDVDAPRIQALGLAGVSDEAVLALAASENRVVLTHDVSTLVALAYRRVEHKREPRNRRVLDSAVQWLPGGDITDVPRAFCGFPRSDRGLKDYASYGTIPRCRTNPRHGTPNEN